MKKKLDIKTVLSKLDTNDFDYFNNMEADDKKSLSPWVLMRYMSSSSSLSELHLITVNELVNKNFNICNKYEDLTVKTLCSTGFGKKMYHSWIAPPKNGVISNKIENILIGMHPHWNIQEVNLFLSLHSTEYILSYIEEMGVDIDE